MPGPAQRVGRFLARLWILVAVIWCGAVGLITWDNFPRHFANGQWWSCCSFEPVQHDAVFRYLTDDSLEMVLPPLLVYALGGALFWAVQALWE